MPSDTLHHREFRIHRWSGEDHWTFFFNAKSKSNNSGPHRRHVGGKMTIMFSVAGPSCDVIIPHPSLKWHVDQAQDFAQLHESDIWDNITGLFDSTPFFPENARTLLKNSMASETSKFITMATEQQHQSVWMLLDVKLYSRSCISPPELWQTVLGRNDGFVETDDDEENDSYEDVEDGDNEVDMRTETSPGESGHRGH